MDIQEHLGKTTCVSMKVGVFEVICTEKGDNLVTS